MDGDLELLSSGTGVYAHVLNGLILNGTATLGQYGRLYFDGGSQTLGGTGTVVFTNNYVQGLIANANNMTLTIGPGITIRGGNSWGNDTGNGSVIGYNNFLGGGSNTSVVNQGTIIPDVSGTSIMVNPNGGTFTNAGTIGGSNGGSLYVRGLAGNVGVATLEGTGSGLALNGTNYVVDLGITAPAGTALTLSGTWTNAGGITINNSTVNLGGNFTLASLGTFNRTGGTVNLTGTLDNTGTTLALDAVTGSWQLAGGTIKGGTVSCSGGSKLVVTSLSGTLDGVVLNGDLDAPAGASVNVNNGLVVNGNIINRGTVNIAYSPVSVAIHGNYTQADSGRMAITLPGPMSDFRYPILCADGKVAIAGQLAITRASGFVPDIASDYPIIIAGSLDGTFTSVWGGDMNPDPDLTPQYGLNGVVLSRAFDRVPLDEFTYTNSVQDDRVFFDVQQAVGATVAFRLYDPAGAFVSESIATPSNPNWGDFGPLNLGSTGGYTLRAYARPGDSPAYTWQLRPAPINARPLTLNTVTPGTISVPGETDHWQFTLAKASEVALDVREIAGTGQEFAFTLLDPDGTAVFYATASSGAPDTADRTHVMLSRRGTYTLVVDGQGDDAATYEFQLSGPSSPHIRSHAVRGSAAGIVDSAWFFFDQPMDTSAGSFNLADDLLEFTSGSNSLTATGYHWEDDRTLVIEFAPQPEDQPLTMFLGPNILTAAGVPLDEDGDGNPGQATDGYAADLIADQTGPHITIAAPQQRASLPLDHISFYFSESIDPRTVSLADVTSFTGPTGDLSSRLTSIFAGDNSVTVYFQSQVVSGTYTMILGPAITDVAGNLMDQDRNGISGESADAYALLIDARTPDLTVASVGNPTATIHGSNMTVNWTVRNDGSDPGQGVWWDYVYLSADDRWDLGDTIVGRAAYDSASRGVLAPNGGTYQGTLTARMPGVMPGEYHLIVRSNLLQTLAETAYTNNTGVSANTAHFDVPTVESYTPINGAINYREGRYFRIDVPADQAGSTIYAQFGTSDTTVANELYLSYGKLPTRQTYDVRSQQALASYQWIILPRIKEGTYYVLAQAAPDYLSTVPLGDFTLQADVLTSGRFTVLDTYFGQGGTAGRRTFAINGVNFDRTMTASLSTAGGPDIPAVAYYRQSAEKLYVTFDLTTVAPGSYDVVLTSATQQDVLAQSFDVVSGGGWSNSPTITAEAAFRRVGHAPWGPFPGHGELAE